MISEKELKRDSLFEWYMKVEKYITGKAKSKLTDIEKDTLAKKYKVQKYREWTLDIKRLESIVEEVMDLRNDSMIKVCVKYYRDNYPEASHYTDQEIIDKGLYKRFYLDSQEKVKKIRLEQKQEQEEYLKEFL